MGELIDKFLEDAKPRDETVPVTEPVQEAPSTVDLDAAFGAAMKRASQLSPDSAANILKLREETGLPQDYIERNTDEVEDMAVRMGIRPAKFRAKNPRLANELTDDPHLAAAAKEDLTGLGWLERHSRRIARSYRRGQINTELGKIGAAAALGSITDHQRALQRVYESELSVDVDDDIEGFFPEFPGQVAEQVPIMFEALKGSVAGFGVGAGTGAGLAALGGQAGPQAAAPEEIVTIPAAALLWGGRGALVGGFTKTAQLEGGLAYLEFEKMKDENGNPLDPEVVREAAMLIGVVNGSLEMVGFKGIAKTIPGVKKLFGEGVKRVLKDRIGRAAVKHYAKKLTTEVGGALIKEGVTEGLQELAPIVVGEIMKADPGTSVETMLSRVFSDENVARMRDAAVTGAKVGGGISFGGSSTSILIESHKAEGRKNFFLALGEKSKESKLRQSVPSRYEDVIDKITKDGPIEDAYIGVDAWNTYFQSIGADPREEAKNLVGSADTYDEASSSGVKMRIPLARYATMIAPTEHNAKLAGELVFDPMQRTPKEISEIKKRLDEMEAKAVEAEAVPESADPVAAPFEQSLLAQNVPATEAKTQAALFARQVRTFASAVGMTPERLQALYPLRVGGAEAEAGQGAMEQGPVFYHATSKESAALIRKSGFKASIGERSLGVTAGNGIFLYEENPGAAKEFSKNFKRPEIVRAFVSGKIFDASARDESIRVLAEDGELIEDLAKEGYVGIKGDELGTPVTFIFDEKAVKPATSETLEQPARGRISFGPGDDTARFQSLLQRLPGADPSTIVHELEHYFLEVLTDIASRDGASATAIENLGLLKSWWKEKADSVLVALREQIAEEEDPKAKAKLEKQLATVMEKGGAAYLRDIAENWETKHKSAGAELLHEYTARGFEAYLMTGKAPTLALGNVFARMRQWLLEIYQEIKRLKVELTPEATRFFDRMVATDAEVATAQAGQMSQADIAALGATETEVAAHAKLVEESKDEAFSQLVETTMADILRERSKEWKAKRKATLAAVTAEIDAMPVYKAMDGIRKDRLSAEAMGEERAKALPGWMVTKKQGGIPPVAAAIKYGYASADDLLNALEAAEPRIQAIQRITDERMAATGMREAPSFADVREAAEKAVHNTKQAELIHLQMKIMSNAKKAGMATFIRRPLPTIQDVREWADGIVNSKVVRKLRPSLYQDAERRAAVAATEAFQKGDIGEAIEQKIQQLRNHELYRASRAATAGVAADVEYASKFKKRATQEAIGKAAPAFWMQISAVLDRFGLIRVQVNKERQPLSEWLASLTEQSLPQPIIGSTVLNEGFRKSYKDLTFAQFAEVMTAIRSIEHIAKMQGKLLREQKKQQIDEAVAFGVASIKKHAKRERAAQFETNLPQDAILRQGASFVAYNRRFASLARQMDGFKDGGALWELFVRPMNEVATRETQMNEEATAKLLDLFSMFSLKDKADIYSRKLVPKTNFVMSHVGRIMVALNAGTAGNRQNLLEGMKITFKKADLTDSDVQAVLNTLDARDLKFIQGIFDLLDSYWPDSKALSERIFGIAPQKIEAQPIVTPAGTIPGGYFPLSYDERQSKMAARHSAEDEADRMIRGEIISSVTRHGFLIERKRNVKLPINMDIGVIFKHLSEVIHAQTHYEFVLDANRLLKHPDMEAAIKNHYGNNYYKEMQNMLRDVASGSIQAKNAAEAMLGYFRRGTTTAVLGFKVATALKQPLGLTASIVRVGPKYMLKALERYLGDAVRMENTSRWINSISETMRLRPRTQIREVNELRNELRLTGKFRTRVDATAMWLTVKMQKIADDLTFLGAYLKAMDELRPDLANSDAELLELDAKVIAVAEQTVVDTQGGGQTKDRARALRSGPVMDIFTMFLTYFNARFNLAYEATAKTNFRSPLDIGRLGVDLLLLYPIPTVIGGMITAAMRGGDDDDDKFTKRMLREVAADPLNDLVLVRELAGAIQGYPYRGPAGVKPFVALNSAIAQSLQGEMDEAFWRALNDSAGTLFHYPAGQLDATIRGFNAWDDDEAGPGAILVGPPPKR